MPSRRTVLAGIAGTIGLYGVANSVRLGGLHVRSIPADTWPLARRDHLNTARTDGRLPRDPAIDWSTGSVGSEFPDGLVVGSDRIYAGGDRVIAIDRAGGDIVWEADGASGTLALTEDRLYAASSPYRDTGPSALRALARDGVERWRVDLPEAQSVLPTREAVFLASHDRIRSIAPNGHVRFVTDVPGGGDVYLMLHDNRLYAGGPMGVARYRRRTVYDALDDRGPGSAWIGGKHGFAGPPTLEGDSLLVGYDDAGAAGAVRALDPGSGSTIWSALRRDGSTDVDRQRARTPVVVNGLAVTALDRWLEQGRSHELVGLDATSGSLLWRRALGSWVSDAAAAAEAAVVATHRDDGTNAPKAADGAPAGAVTAIAPDGSERWRVAFDVGVSEIAPVDGTVFALLEDGRVVALRD